MLPKALIPVIRVCRRKGKKHKRLLILCSAFMLFILHGSLVLQPENVIGACQLMKIDFHHRSFQSTFWYEKPVSCNKWESLVYFDEHGLLQLNTAAINTSGHSDIKCFYSIVKRSGQNEVSFSESIPFEFPTMVKADFVHITCKNSDSYVVYSNLHNKVYSSEIIKQNEFQNETEEQLSIVILGIDSLSTLVANRMLRKTLPFLQNELKAYILDSYTKVGENTLTNLAAALMGRSLPELLKLVVDFPELFKEIKRRGYIDCYAEDWATYRPNVGLYLPQYTHNLRTLILAGQKVELYIKEKHNITKNKKSNTRPLCYGNRMRHRIVLEYARQCFEAYKNKRKYIFMWINEISHHQSNFVQLADQDFVSFFQWLNNTGRMDKTIVVMMSDHGPRYGPVPKTNLGRFTNRHPFMALMLPKQLTNRYPHIHRNLETNRHRLTSPFDFHETLRDIVFQRFKRQKQLKDPLPRGISLFREVPKHRSCHDAAISEDNCPCYVSSNQSVDEPYVVGIAYYTVTVINNFLKPYKDICAKLSLLSVETANIHHIPSSMMTTEGAIRYTLALHTTPGNAFFEVTVDFVNMNNIYILGEIARRNQYKGQTDCVEAKDIEQYCLCIKNES